MDASLGFAAGVGVNKLFLLFHHSLHAQGLAPTIKYAARLVYTCNTEQVIPDLKVPRFNSFFPNKIHSTRQT